MSRRADPRLIGLFVLAGVALAVVGVVLFGSGQLFRTTHAFVSYFDSNVSGLQSGAPVKFRGVEVGSVDQVLLNLSGRAPDPGNVSIPVVFSLDEERIRARGVGLDLGDRAVVDSLIEAGLRATLAVESLVTGRIYIELDMFPDRSAVFRGETPRHPEIPTVTTGFEELQEQLYTIVRKAAAIELDTIVGAALDVVRRVEELVGTPEVGEAVQTLTGTVAALDRTIAEARSLMATMDSTIDPLRVSLTETAERFRASAEELDAALIGVRTTLEPGSPVTVELQATLRELSAAARSFRELAEYLERNPSALIRGRPGRPEREP